MKAITTPEATLGKTARSMAGRKEMQNLVRGNIYEGSATNYNREERELFSTQKEIDLLIESLEKKS